MSKSPPTSNAAILMVDDRPENLLAMEVVLEPLNVPLVRALSGEEALRHLQTRDFAVVLLDVQMPRFDGFQTALRMREQTRGAQTPIIFLTAHYTNETALLRGYAEGAVDYISKPFQPQVLRSKVKIFVELFNRIQDCRSMGAELKRLNQDLERRVELRTSELTRAVEGSKRASTAKSTFLASMSHELRTPLNSILGFAEFLEEELEQHPTRNLAVDARKLRLAGEHLLSLVNGLLDLARIEAGRLEFQDETFNACSVLSDVVQMMQPLAEQHNNTIEVETTDDNIQIHTDRQKLTQVVINLVANAVKFTKDGKVLLSCKRADAGADPWVRYEILDTGPGLSPGQIARLFGEYEQGEPPAGDPVEGTGLGLAISRQLAIAINGTLEACNRPEGGACFKLNIPSNREAATPPNTGS